MSRKRQQPKRGKRQHDPKRRCERLARQLVIYGWRQEPGEDLLGGVRRPLTMHDDCTRATTWASWRLYRK